MRNHITAEVDNVEKITAATVCLHNFLRISEKNTEKMPKYIALQILPTPFEMMVTLIKAYFEKNT